MLSLQAFNDKKWRKELKRRKLRAYRHRIMAQFGPTLGQHIYDSERAQSKGQELVRRYIRRSDERPRLPKMVPMGPEPQREKKSLWRRIFS